MNLRRLFMSPEDAADPNVTRLSDSFDWSEPRVAPRAPKMPSPLGQAVAGAYNGAVAPALDFMGSPAGWATSAVPALGPLASRGLAALFAPYAFKNAAEATGRAKDAILDPNSTLQDKVTPLADALSQGLMAVGASRHAIPAPNLGRLGIVPEGMAPEAPAAGQEPIRAIHYSREPLRLDPNYTSEMGNPDNVWGGGLYAMEPHAEDVWTKEMDRWEPGQHRNEVQIAAKNPLVVSPENLADVVARAQSEGVQLNNYSTYPLDEWMQQKLASGDHDALVLRGFFNKSKGIDYDAIDARLRQYWQPQWADPARGQGKFLNGDEYDAAHARATQELYGMSPQMLNLVSGLQDQVFVPPKNAGIVSLFAPEAPAAGQDARFAELEARAKAGDQAALAEAQAMVDQKATGLSPYEMGDYQDTVAKVQGLKRQLQAAEKQYSKASDDITRSNASDDIWAIRQAIDEGKSDISDYEKRLKGQYGTTVWHAKQDGGRLGELENRPMYVSENRDVAEYAAQRGAEKLYSNVAPNEIKNVSGSGLSFIRRPTDVRLADLASGGYAGGKSIMSPFDRKEMSETILLDPRGRLKLANAFTYGDDGKLIPLSQRFNPLNPDVRYMAPAALGLGALMTGALSQGNGQQ